MDGLQIIYWEIWHSPTDRWGVLVSNHPNTGVFSVYHTGEDERIDALQAANPERGSRADFIGLDGWAKYRDDFYLEQAAIKFTKRVGPKNTADRARWRLSDRMFDRSEQLPPDDPTNPFDQDDNGFAARLRRHVRKSELNKARTPDSANAASNAATSDHIWLTAPSDDGGKGWHGYVQKLDTGMFVPVVHISRTGSEETPGTRNQVGSPMPYDEAIEIINTRAAKKLGQGYSPKAER